MPVTTVVQAFDPGPARRVLERLLGAGRAGQIEPLAVPAADEVDRYRIRAADSNPYTAYAFGAIIDFGGRSLLGANAATWTDRYPEASAARESALSGIAWMPEASGHDPAAFELFAELGWRAEAFDLTDTCGTAARPSKTP